MLIVKTFARIALEYPIDSFKIFPRETANAIPAMALSRVTSQLKSGNSLMAALWKATILFPKAVILWTDTGFVMTLNSIDLKK